MLVGLGIPAPIAGDDAPPLSPPSDFGKTVRVAGIVVKWVGGDKEANFRRVEPMIRQAAQNGAKIVCTTECFLDGYAIADKSIPLDGYRALGEPIPDGKYFSSGSPCRVPARPPFSSAERSLFPKL